MSKEDEISIIAPVGIMLGWIILCVFNKQVIYAGKLILYIWNCFTQ